MSDASDVLKQLRGLLGSAPTDLRALVPPPPPRPLLRQMMYGFPVAVLEPGEERSVKTELRGMFRPQKLIMVGQMREIRGHFKIKRSRLPLLDRGYVTAYSRIYKCRRGKKVWFRPGRTTVEYRARRSARSPIEGFKRSYLPSSVKYVPVDPLEYVMLKQVLCGAEPQMPSASEGVVGAFFGASRFDNELPMSSTNVSVSLVLENRGDIQVRVHVTLCGPGQ